MKMTIKEALTLRNGYSIIISQDYDFEDYQKVYDMSSDLTSINESLKEYDEFIKVIKEKAKVLDLKKSEDYDQVEKFNLQIRSLEEKDINIKLLKEIPFEIIKKYNIKLNGVIIKTFVDLKLIKLTEKQVFSFLSAIYLYKSKHRE